jgi:hypothetical protein
VKRLSREETAESQQPTANSLPVREKMSAHRHSTQSACRHFK